MKETRTSHHVCIASKSGTKMIAERDQKNKELSLPKTASSDRANRVEPLAKTKQFRPLFGQLQASTHYLHGLF